tara:strand:- start:736 stop:1149 length:414 start_codon:yes stop_codon:yes gene_type:complete
MTFPNLCNISSVSLVLILTILLSACQTPVSVNPKQDGGATAKYQINSLTAELETDMDTVFRASIQALDMLGYFRTGEVHEEESITIFSRKVGDEKIFVHIFQEAAEKVLIQIRIGILGNLPESQTILAEIQDIIMNQ